MKKNVSENLSFSLFASLDEVALSVEPKFGIWEPGFLYSSVLKQVNNIQAIYKRRAILSRLKTR